MKKFIIFILVAIVLAWIYISSGGNVSSSEKILSQSKVQNNISKINEALDAVGDKKFYNIDIVSDQFTGEIEQPVSSFLVSIPTYLVKGIPGTPVLQLTYGASDIGVTFAAPIVTPNIYESHLPADAKTGTSATVPAKGLLDGISPGIRPILKDSASSKEWIHQLMFSETGMGLDKMTQYKTTWDTLKADPAKQSQFLAWVMGNTATPEWNQYKADRIVAMRQINVDSLTGLSKNAQTLELIDPNRTTLYEVVNVNTTSFKNLSAGLTALGLTGITNEARFMSDLSNHLDQKLGGKLIIIPNQDASLVMYDNAPLFIIN